MVLDVVEVEDVPTLSMGLDKVFPANALYQLNVPADTLTQLFWEAMAGSWNVILFGVGNPPPSCGRL